MSTTLIALGVVVAVLAVALTPGFLDFSSLFHLAAGELPAERNLAASSLQEAGHQSVEVLGAFLKKASLSK